MYSTEIVCTYIERRKWQPTLVFLPEKSHGQRSLVGYSSWDHRRVRHDLVTRQHQHKYTFLQAFFLYQLLENVEYSSLCCAESPCWLSVSYTAVWCVNRSFPIYPFPPPCPFGSHKFVSLFSFFFFDSTCNWYHMIFIFVWLTALSMIISRFLHVSANGIISSFFMA